MNLVQVTKVMDSFTSKVDDFQVLEETVNNAMVKSTSNMVSISNWIALLLIYFVSIFFCLANFKIN